MIVTPQPRGQITLPVKFRRKYGIEPGVPIRVVDVGDGVKVVPLTNSLSIKPKYTKEEIVEKFKKIEASGKVYWTAGDDKRLAKLREKDDKYLNW
jgi:bifunctional DNA-binding transcriptional regulator/antitoxin component of YhaV-PrlF toxin-antitoxin module